MCHTLNKVYFRSDTKKIPYELWRGKNTSKYLVVSATYFEIMRILKSLMQRVIRGSFLDTPHQAEHTGCTSANLVINDEQHASEVKGLECYHTFMLSVSSRA